MSEFERLLLALAADPGDDTGWLAMADCLEEGDDPRRAELVRLQLSLRRRLDHPHWAAWEDRLRCLWADGVEGCQPALSDPFGIDYVLIPPGEFWMGAPDGEQWRDDDEPPRRRVTLTTGFWMARTPVTRRQWRAVIDRGAIRLDSDDLPADGVSYHLAQRFCARYNEVASRTCRLPTEAEWEYACRAGTATSFCSGEGVEALRQVGWCSYDGTWDSSGGPRQVRQLRPNSWGLHDMHGNVWEWCADGQWAEDGERMSRGGSWRGGPWFCRSAERWAQSPDVEGTNNGLRVLLELT